MLHLNLIQIIVKQHEDTEKKEILYKSLFRSLNNLRAIYST